MAPDTAARLAHRLIQVHGESLTFFFELDTAENASLVADELRALGCAVLFDSNDFRLQVFVPLHKVRSMKKQFDPQGPIMIQRSTG